jgi:KDO2-lipid IV(A) lauroyltransferase
VRHPVSLILALISGFVRLWPEALVRATATIGGALLFSVLRYRRRVILDNLARALPELEPHARVRLGARVARHLFHTLLDFLRLPRWAARGFPGVRIEGLEHIDRAAAEGRGVLILSGHLGAFELGAAAYAAARPERPLACVVKPFPPPVDAWITRLRTSAGLGLVPAKGAGLPVLRKLKRGEQVVFVLDQNATRHSGVFVEFFGRPACTMSGLAVLAQRSGAPVVPVAVWREPDGTHALRFEPAIPFERTASLPEDVTRMTQIYTRWLEARIRERPEQWFWSHRRWKTQPESPEAPADPELAS